MQLGRITLATIPTIWVVAYATRPVWIGAPNDNGLPDHPLAVTFFVLSLAISACSPFLVLPVGLAALSEVRPSQDLVVRTVLGRRRIDLRALRRIGALRIEARTALPSHLVYLRDEQRRWVFLWLGPNPRLPTELRLALTSAGADRPETVSARARSMLRMGAAVPLGQRIALGTFSFVVGFAAYGVWFMVTVSLVLWVWMPH